MTNWQPNQQILGLLHILCCMVVTLFSFLQGIMLQVKKKLAFTEISTLTHNKRYDTYWYPIFK